MNRILLLVFSFMLFCSIKGNALPQQDVVTLSFADKANCGFEIIPLNQKIINQPNFGKGFGAITINFMDVMPDSLKRTIRKATELWESFLNVDDSVYVNIYFEPFVENDIITDVVYQKNADNPMYFPKSLLRHKKDSILAGCNFDAEIRINSNTKWDCSTTPSNSNKNLYQATLQSVCRCLGYGSSVKKGKNGRFKFIQKNGITVFDSYIFDENGKYVPSLNIGNSSQIESYAQQKCGYLFFCMNDDAHKLYAPQQYDEAKSLKTSQNPKSLMYYGQQNNNTNIDKNTLNVLSTIGWNFDRTNRISIIPYETNTELFSAYKKHSFHATSSLKLTHFQWELRLPLKDNRGYRIIYTSYTKDFEVPILNDYSNFEKDENGIVNGVVILKADDGVENFNCAYKIKIDLKPCFTSTALVSTSKIVSNLYDAVVDAYYLGSNNIHLYVIEKGYPGITTYNSENDDYTRFEVKGLSVYGEYTLKIIAKNAYGIVFKDIPIPAQAEFKNAQYKGNIIGECNDSRIEQYGVLTKDDHCMFFRSDSKLSNWHFFIRKYSYDKRTIYEQVIDAPSSIDLGFAISDVTYDWKKAYRDIVPGDNQLYFDGLVVSECGEKADSFLVRLALVPPKPIIKDVSLTYDYFDFEDMGIVNGQYRLSVEADNCDRFVEISACPFPDNGIYRFYTIEELKAISKEGNRYLVGSNFLADTRLYIESGNPYGYSMPSDTINTTDYIEDKRIVDKINEWLLLDGISDNMYHGMDITINNMCLTLTEKADIYIISAEGQIVCTAKDSEQIDLSTIKSGVYIVNVINKKKQKTVKKILL